MKSLTDLCLTRICTSHDALCLNLDNALDVLEFARLHHFQPLIDQTERFVRSAYRGLRAKHTHEALAATLGASLFDELERDVMDADEKIAQTMRLGAVVEGAAVPSTLSHLVEPWSGDATSQWRPAYVGQRPAAPPAAPHPSVEARVVEVAVDSGGVPNASWTCHALRTWLKAACVGVPIAAAESDSAEAHAALVELAVETQQEIEAEARALAEFEQAATARRDPHVVTARGQGGRETTILDDARAGEEQARREMLEEQARRDVIEDGVRAATAGTAALAVVHGVAVDVNDGGVVPAMVVTATPVQHAAPPGPYS